MASGFSAAGYEGRRADEWISDLRDFIVAELGFEVDFDRDEILGVLTLAVGVALGIGSAENQSMVDGWDPDAAAGVMLAKLAKMVGVLKRPATRSRYTVKAIASDTPKTYAKDSIIEGGGVDDHARWSVVADTMIGTSTTDLLIEAVSDGPVTLPSGVPTTFRKITSLSNVTITYDPLDADSFSVGRLAESDPELRVRRRLALAKPGSCSHPGLRAAILALLWPRACTVTTPVAGRIAVVVSPAPADADQRAALANAIFGSTAYGMRWDGSETETITKPDGTTDTVAWDDADVQAVVISISGLTFAAGVNPDEAKAALAAVVRARFAELTRGSTLFYLRMIGALDTIGGITGGTITLDGGSVSIPAPNSTTLLVLDGDAPVFV